MLDIRQMQAIDAVAANGSMAAAARALGWSQPTLAHHLAALESALGSPVVHRRARGSQLTDAGRALEPFARRIIELTVNAEHAARAASSNASRVTVAMFSTAGAFLLPKAIRELRSAGIGIELVESDDGRTLRRELALGLADAAIVWEHPGDEAGDSVELLSEPLYILAPADHPLAGRRTATIYEFADDDWIMARGAGDPCDAVLLDASARDGFRPHCILKTDDYGVAQGYVAAGLGVALVPAMALLSLNPNVAVVPVSDAGARRRVRLEVAPHAKKDPRVTAVASALLESAREVSKELSSVDPRVVRPGHS